MSHAIRIHKPGGPEVLKWEEVEVGDPGPGQVRLRQEAAGLNFIDVYHRTGLYPQQAAVHPRRRGRRRRRGGRARRCQRQSGRSGRLCRADRRLCRRAADRRRPGGEAARRYLLRASRRDDAPGHDRADAAPLGVPDPEGDTILVHAAAGGVGLIMCQWAAALGATVIGTVGTRRKSRARACPWLRPPDRLFAPGLRRGGATHHGRREAAGGLRFGRPDTFLKSLDCLKTRGLMVSFGNASGPPEPIAPGILAQKGSLYPDAADAVPLYRHSRATRAERARTVRHGRRAAR